MDIGAFIGHANKSASIAALSDAYRAYMGAIGYDQFVFSLMTDHPRLDRRAEHGVICTYPAGWMAYYRASGYAEIDPVRHRIATAGGAFTLESLRPQGLQKKLMVQAEAAGLHDGICVALHGPHGTIAGVGAAGSARLADRSRDTLDHANLLTQHFYKRFCELETKYAEPPVALSPREIATLQQYAYGKSRRDVAASLGITESAVKFHSAGFLKKLNSPNITAAVLAAYSLGLITR